MSTELPDYYALLHVDPGAPEAVIRASYRTLMQRLGAHPDLGGDHEFAASLNAAWATLRDPVRRAAYDAARMCAARPIASGGGAAAPKQDRARCAPGDRQETATSNTSHHGDRKRPDGGGPADRYNTAAATAAMRIVLAERCPFCLEAAKDLAYRARTAETCGRCSAPLTLVQSVSAAASESQRAVYRISRAEPLRVYSEVDDKVGVSALVHDISLTGMRFSCQREYVVGAIARSECVICSAVVRIAHASPGARGMWQYGAEFLTVRFSRQRGSLLSVPV